MRPPLNATAFSARLVVICAMFAASLASVGCGFLFERLKGVEPGDVRGRAVQDEAREVVVARVAPEGASVVRRALA